MQKVDKYMWPTALKSAATGLLLLLASLSPSIVLAFLTDSASHPPPTTGALAYNNDIRPALGGTYVDPVFNERVIRLSNVGANAAGDDLYGHSWGNANGSRILHNNANGTSYFRVVSAVDGSVINNDDNRPYGGSLHRGDVIWHPTNADKYLYQNGSQLLEYTVSTSSSALVKDFGTALESLGSSQNWVSKDGNIFIVRWGGFGHVYNRQLDLVYTGNLPPAQASGWFGMTPSGKHVITARDASNWQISYLIDHVAHTVDTVGIKFWNRCGDHAVPVSGSDGKDYVVTAACFSTQGLYRVDVTLDQNPGGTPRSDAQQTGDNLLLLDNIGFTFDFHATHGPVGSGQNWVFVDTEAFAGSDDFNQAPSSWVKFEQEIIAVNYITLALRRLAHHRSRQPLSNYYYQPRISSSWDGSLVIWASNMNISSPAAYSDFYAIANPLGTTYHPIKFVLLITGEPAAPPEYSTLDACNTNGKAKVARLSTTFAMKTGLKYSYQCLQVQGAANDQAYEKVA